jgi:hypothetical protein
LFVSSNFVKERYKRSGEEKSSGKLVARRQQERKEERGEERYRILSSKRAITVR